MEPPVLFSAVVRQLRGLERLRLVYRRQRRDAVDFVIRASTFALAFEHSDVIQRDITLVASLSASFKYYLATNTIIISLL